MCCKDQLTPPIKVTQLCCSEYIVASNHMRTLLSYTVIWFIVTGGLYHGKLVFPHSFPMSPPSIMVSNTNTTWITGELFITLIASMSIPDGDSLRALRSGEKDLYEHE